MKIQCQWTKTPSLKENTVQLNENTVTEWKHCYWMKMMLLNETTHWIKTLLLNEDHAIKKTQCQCMRMLLLNENSVYEWKHLHSTKIISFT